MLYEVITPFYSVKHGEKPVLNPSKMGFILANNDRLDSDLELVSNDTSSFDETWEQVWGEKQFIRNNYNQLTVKLREKKGKKREMDIEFRAFDDGVAYRYIYKGDGSADSIFIMDEVSEFALADSGKAWWIPAYGDNRYEYLFEKSNVITSYSIHYTKLYEDFC